MLWHAIGLILLSKASHSARQQIKISGDFTVLGRGYAWSVTKKAIREFFGDINIVNGEDGIQLYKSGAMETQFDVASNDDLIKALALNGKRMGSRIIGGEQ